MEGDVVHFDARRVIARQEPDDGRLASGKRKHAFATRAQEDGRVGPLDGLGKTIEVIDRVIGAGERQRAGSPKPLEYLQRFFLKRLNRLVAVRRERGCVIAATHCAFSTKYATFRADSV